MANKIRTLALCVFLRDDKIFIAEGYDSKKQQAFYRPIGGGIEFGERAVEAVAREILEEMGAVVEDLDYLGTVENIFTYEGEPGHEIIMLYNGSFREEHRNQDDYTATGTDDGDVLYNASWKPLEIFRDGSTPLYPEGLLELLDEYREE